MSGDLLDEVLQRSFQAMAVLGHDLAQAATASGSHPPWMTLVRLEVKKAISTVSKTPPPAVTSARRVCQNRRAIERKSTVVRTKVPVTATPYAAASPLEEPKAKTIARTITNRIALIAGT